MDPKSVIIFLIIKNSLKPDKFFTLILMIAFQLIAFYPNQKDRKDLEEQVVVVVEEVDLVVEVDLAVDAVVVVLIVEIVVVGLVEVDLNAVAAVVDSAEVEAKEVLLLAEINLYVDEIIIWCFYIEVIK